jgi:hypothetical protein
VLGSVDETQKERNSEKMLLVTNERNKKVSLSLLHFLSFLLFGSIPFRFECNQQLLLLLHTIANSDHARYKNRSLPHVFRRN